MINRFQYFCYIALIVTVLPAAGEILYPTPDDLISATDNYSYPGNMTAFKYFKIHLDNFEMLKGMPLEKYENLEAVVIEFGGNPDAPDTVKEKLIVSLENKLPLLSHLRKCPRLKYLVMHTGEFLFIRSTDGLPYNNSDPTNRKKAAILNLERLDRRFGKKLSDMLPGIKIYAHNWGW